MKARLTVALALLILVFSFPAAARASHSANCQDIADYNSHAGEFLLSTLYGANGIRAVLNNLGIPEQCTDNGGWDQTSATSLWVGIQDGQAGQGSGIVQIGVVKCQAGGTGYWQGVDACETQWEDTWRLFYAYQGCPGHTGAWPRDLGPANIVHDYEFKVTHDTTNVYFYIDDVRVATHPYSIMSCWDDKYDVLTVGCETKDRADSCGGFAGAPSRFEGIKQRILNSSGVGTWDGSGNVSGPCAFDGTNSNRYQCSVVNGATVDLWSVQ